MEKIWEDDSLGRISELMPSNSGLWLHFPYRSNVLRFQRQRIAWLPYLVIDSCIQKVDDMPSVTIRPSPLEICLSLLSIAICTSNAYRYSNTPDGAAFHKLEFLISSMSLPNPNNASCLFSKVQQNPKVPSNHVAYECRAIFGTGVPGWRFSSPSILLSFGDWEIFSILNLVHTCWLLKPRLKTSSSFFIVYASLERSHIVNKLAPVG